MARPIQPPVIVLPGITAASLRDHYALDPENVWTLLRKRYDRIALHPDDLRYERQEPARLLPDRLFSVPYDDFVNELRHNLSPRQDEPVPVYPLAYDWRLPLAESQRLLGQMIDEIVVRTRLMQHYHHAGYGDDPRVDLVGHSMGGLIIAGYLAGSADRRVRKVATLGTPYLGSLEAVVKVAVGTAELGVEESGSLEREAARLTPALYHLLPSFDDAILSDDPAVPAHFFDAGAWQPGVIETIAENLRLYGLDASRAKTGPGKSAREEAARALLQDILDDARAHRDTVASFTLDHAGLSDDDWLAIVGVGQTTRTALRVELRAGDPFFDLRSDERKNGWPTAVTGPGGEVVAHPWETGDGTVPYRGARAPFVDTARVIAVAPADFGYFELRDRALAATVGLHGMLPAMNVVQKLVVAFLKGPAGGPGAAHPGIWGRAAPDLGVRGAWSPPIRGLRRK